MKFKPLKPSVSIDKGHTRVIFMAFIFTINWLPQIKNWESSREISDACLPWKKIKVSDNTVPEFTHGSNGGGVMSVNRPLADAPGAPPITSRDFLCQHSLAPPPNATDCISAWGLSLASVICFTLQSRLAFPGNSHPHSPGTALKWMRGVVCEYCTPAPSGEIVLRPSPPPSPSLPQQD